MTNLGAAKGDFKKLFYNHRKSFNNETTANKATLSKYIWKLKETSNSSMVHCQKSTTLFKYI